MQFDDIKTETLNLRVSPTFKAVLKALADAEHRSMVNNAGDTGARKDKDGRKCATA